MPLDAPWNICAPCARCVEELEKGRSAPEEPRRSYLYRALLEGRPLSGTSVHSRLYCNNSDD